MRSKKIMQLIVFHIIYSYWMILNDNFFCNFVALFHFHSFATLVPINGERPVGFSLSMLDFLPSKTNLFMLEFCGRDNYFVLIEYCIVFIVFLFVITFFFVKYLVCANRLTCLGVSQDYLGAGEKSRGLALQTRPQGFSLGEVARYGGSAYKLQEQYPKEGCLPKAMRCFELYSVNSLNQSQLELNARTWGKRTWQSC